MSNLSLHNSSGVMPFLTLTAVFLFIGPVLFIGIATMWSNLKQKISDELSARVTRIVNDLGTKNNTPEIENIFSKLTAEINTKITNELSACLSEVNASFTAELSKINTELNNKLTAEIEIFKARDAGYATEAQKILGRLNNIKEACHNDFGSIRSLVESVTSRFMSINVVIDLQNKINQHYAVVQRSDFDQLSVSNECETDSRGSSTNSSSSSSSQKFANIISVIREQFMEIFDRIKGANDYSLDQMCGVVSVDILRLGMGVIGKDTIKGFYRGENLNSKNLEKIGAWIDNSRLHYLLSGGEGTANIWVRARQAFMLYSSLETTCYSIIFYFHFYLAGWLFLIVFYEKI